jgi:hypothetical protein
VLDRLCPRGKPAADAPATAQPMVANG